LPLTQIAAWRTLVGVRDPRSSAIAWAGYAACGLGLIFAAVSFYWGAGGTLGLDTIGGAIERLGRARDPRILAAVWVTGVLKVLGGLLALALVGAGAKWLPRWPVALLGWGAAVVLTVYGGSLVASEALVASGAIRPATPVDWKPLLWHLYLWDMSFLVWGLLFGVAAWQYTRTA
jgi:uncharacterized protein DUF3995